LFGEVAVIEPSLLVCIVFDELGPFGYPLFNCIIESLSSDFDLVLRVGVVVTHSWEDFVTL
jgi:hypothetical protein